MFNPICSKSFLLSNDISERLFENYARDMPIYDYHNHLSAKEIYEDKKFDTITDLWLAGDHYKWRAMRTNGINEKYITGNATSWEKFYHWAITVPATLRNPLYHWTHLELKNTFGIEEILDGHSAEKIYHRTTELLKTDSYSVRNLLRKFNVAAMCTTDDPVDSLEWHIKLKNSDFEIQVSTAFRPDQATNISNTALFNNYLQKLEDCTQSNITCYLQYKDALKARHEYFHDQGCRLSDHGLECPFPGETASDEELDQIFQQIKMDEQLGINEQSKFRSALLNEIAKWNFEKGWVQQYHVGALRDVNTRAVRMIGQACGFDSIADFSYASSMGDFFNRLEEHQMLAKTIIYNLNPSDNEVIASMIGNFQDGIIPGKMQYGAAWWFLDQKTGIQKHINTLSNLGLLSQFVGMVTDSRSFLSFSRHEYFRRILCDLLGCDVKNGELPDDDNLLGKLVKDICYNNAKNYFIN